MLIKKLILSSLVLCAAFCCKEDDVDCSLVDCLGVDNSIYFMVLDETSSENLFTNGTYMASQVSIRDSNDSPVAFELQKDFQDEDMLVLDLGPDTVGALGFTITLENLPPFRFELSTFYDGGSDCCGPYTGVDSASLTGIGGEFVNRGTLPIEVTVLVP